MSRRADVKGRLRDSVSLRVVTSASGDPLTQRHRAQESCTIVFQAPLDPADPQTMITLLEALPTKSGADQEADRLNDLASSRAIEVVNFSVP